MAVGMTIAQQMFNQSGGIDPYLNIQNRQEVAISGKTIFARSLRSSARQCWRQSDTNCAPCL
jgi:hypothetical protein